MKVASGLFLGGILAFLPVAAIYGYFSHFEPVGTVGIFLLGIMTGMVGFYLRATAHRLDTDPADKPRALIEEAAGDYGFFSPHSWWPLALAFCALLLFLGLAVGWWVFVIGAFTGVFALVGWTFEYFRGDVI